ncbi:hypothetical protein H0H92_005696 [Tricholoma furcatifolium]|nr:hypothetical protein H0H92_005696 [Tricholoma furcatifolium]
MAKILHLISSTSPRCVFNTMQRFVADSDDPPHTLDLGPLVGTTRAFKTRERVPGSGDLGGVEMDDKETEDGLDVLRPRFPLPRPPDPPLLAETMPPKNQCGGAGSGIHSLCYEGRRG